MTATMLAVKGVETISKRPRIAGRSSLKLERARDKRIDDHVDYLLLSEGIVGVGTRRAVARRQVI